MREYILDSPTLRNAAWGEWMHRNYTHVNFGAMFGAPKKQLFQPFCVKSQH
jgi:hypothetical protein